MLQGERQMAQRQPHHRQVPAHRDPARTARHAAGRGHVRHRRQRHPARERQGQGDRQGAEDPDRGVERPERRRHRQDGEGRRAARRARTSSGARRSSSATSSTAWSTGSRRTARSGWTGCPADAKSRLDSAVEGGKQALRTGDPDAIRKALDELNDGLLRGGRLAVPGRPGAGAGRRSRTARRRAVPAARAAGRRAGGRGRGRLRDRGREQEVGFAACHPERSEGGHAGHGPLRCVQGDKQLRLTPRTESRCSSPGSPARGTPRPRPAAGRSSRGSRPWFTQVRFMLPAESRSTSAEPSALPKYQSPSTSSCAASTGVSSSREPGDDVHHAARQVGGVEHLVEVGRRERRSWSTGPRPPCSPSRSRAAPSRPGPAAAARRGRRCRARRSARASRA